MAKGLRAGNIRKAKALRRQNIYKPVEDARMERLAKIQEACLNESVLNQRNNVNQLSSRMEADSKKSNNMDIDSSSTTVKALKANIKKNSKQHKQGRLLNLYGLSRKETKFRK